MRQRLDNLRECLVCGRECIAAGTERGNCWDARSGESLLVDSGCCKTEGSQCLLMQRREETECDVTTARLNIQLGSFNLLYLKAQV